MTQLGKLPVHTLRSILRYIRSECPSSSLAIKTRTLTKENTINSLRTFVLDRYRNDTENNGEIKTSKHFAYNYSLLAKDLQERKRLYELDASAENTLSPLEMTRRSAARAGLQLPELAGENKP